MNSPRYPYNRMAALARADYVARVGPSVSFKMYAITEKVERALEHHDLYDHDIGEKSHMCADGELSPVALDIQTDNRSNNLYEIPQRHIHKHQSIGTSKSTRFISSCIWSMFYL